MNNQSINATTSPRLILLSKLSITWLTDALNLYLFVLLGLIGTLFNLISFIIFLKKIFRKVALFKYMIVNTLNSLISSFGFIFFFYFSLYHLFEISTSYNARIFKCHIFPSVITAVLLIFGNSLDILMNIERTFNYSNGYQRYKKISPYLFCIGTFTISLVLSIPTFLTYDIVSDKELYIKNKLCVFSSFSMSSSGKIASILVSIIQGPGIFMITTITYLISMRAFKSYLVRKYELNPQTSDQNQIKDKLKKTDQQLFWMTFYLSAYSALLNLVQFGTQISILFLNLNTILIAVLTSTYSFVIILKHLSNIFFYYYFNSKFRKSLDCGYRQFSGKKSSIDQDINYSLNFS